MIVGVPGRACACRPATSCRAPSRPRPGAVNSEILIQLEGGATVAAIVTNDSAQELGLKQGSPAVAIFKASNVILGVLD